MVASAAFAGAAALFVLWFTIRYAPGWGGSFGTVLFGLWGLYWGAGLAWGAYRIRPREARGGLFQGLMWATVPQAFFFVVFWGALLMEVKAPDVGRTAVVAFFAGPLIAVGLAFSSRRWLVFVLAQFLGPAGFGALYYWGT